MAGATAAALGSTSTMMAAASADCRPCIARAGPICQRPGRTARTRISSTVVRVGPPENATSVRSVRETISNPFNGATDTFIGSDDRLTAWTVYTTSSPTGSRSRSTEARSSGWAC
jgi:hypothetical protein